MYGFPGFRNVQSPCRAYKQWANEGVAFFGITITQLGSMLDSIFASNNYQASKVMLDVAEKRHQVMAGNLANVDTPGYKRVDIDPNFRAQLEKSVQTGQISKIQEISDPVFKEVAGLKATRMDGNNVSLEKELMHINHNALEYQALSQFVSSSLQHLKMAIKGQVD